MSNNRPLKIAIVEDQQENIDILKFYFDQYPDQYKIKYIAMTPDDARENLTNKDIDLALLDIDLGEETIFDVLNDIDYQHLNQSLVFVTAHGTFENALKAIRYSCLNFITKPIDFDEMYRTLQKVQEEKAKIRPSQIEVLLDILKDNAITPKKIGIFLSKGVIQFVTCDSILYMTANDSLAQIYLENADKLVSTRHLGHYDKLLDSHKDFIRIHKSTIVNRQHVKKLNSKNRIVIMTNNEELEISKRRLKEVQRIIR